MKTFSFGLGLLVLAAVTIGKPAPGTNVISTINEKGELVTEDLDAPVAVTFAVNINDLRYMLYTQKNQGSPYQLKYNDVSNLNNSPFDSKKATKFILHGWESSYEAAPPQSLKDAFLNALDVNVVMLDWKEYNSPYVSAVGSAENVGKNFATFIEFLISKGGLKSSDIHIIGHSLGAHIAGFIGKNLNQQANRITGLDPAGPMFKDRKEIGRLDAGDALFVDALHTSTMAGINMAITQADFFPNGGSNQPACLSAPVSGGCDHTAGYDYFGASITQKALYPARKCSNEDDAKIADSKISPCVSSNAVMGDDAVNRSERGIYYVAV